MVMSLASPASEAATRAAYLPGAQDEDLHAVNRPPEGRRSIPSCLSFRYRWLRSIPMRVAILAHARTRPFELVREIGPFEVLAGALLERQIRNPPPAPRRRGSARGPISTSRGIDCRALARGSSTVEPRFEARARCPARGDCAAGSWPPRRSGGTARSRRCANSSMNHSTSAGMSSACSRSGGTSRGTTFRR